MSFTVSVPASAHPPATIDPGAFWPEIDPAAIRAAQRIDETITGERLTEALYEAIATVNGELRAWKEGQLAAGIATLAEIEAERIDDTTIPVFRYRRAVGCLAKALLLERYRDYDSAARGDRKAEALTDPIDDLRRDARWAISDILGLGRSTVELI